MKQAEMLQKQSIHTHVGQQIYLMATAEMYRVNDFTFSARCVKKLFDRWIYFLCLETIFRAILLR